MTDMITMIELFSGIGAQERGLRQLGLSYEVAHTCDCDKDAVLSYAAMRYDLEKEIAEYDFPSQDKMIEELQARNIGYDFEKEKHTITSRIPLTKLKQYYIADKITRNLGDISKVERLPYADMVTYSTPCQSFSVAGKLAGAAKTCKHCGHKWDIDFSNPDYNYKCPICNNTSLESTTSGLLQEVQRLLSIAYENNELPKYLLLENVKNLVGKTFKPQFDAWVKWLDSIGYNTYYQVLNAKNYGIAQNRERVFALSIRKDVDTEGFEFPEQIKLTTRLKHVLEKNVPEKYYLPDERIEKILSSDFMKQKYLKSLQTLISDDEVHQIMNIMPGTNRDNPNQGRVYDVDGIAPTLTKMDGGNRQPFIIDKDDADIQKVFDIPKEILNDNERQRRVYSPDGIAPTLLNRSDSPKIQVIGNYSPSNHDASRVVDIDGIAPTVKENHGTVTAIAEPFIVASRGRNPDNPSDRTPGSPTEQRLEPNFSGCTNTLTSVQKDNYICEPQVLRAERTEYGKAIRKQYEAGEIQEKIGNMREMKPRTDGVANTITTVQKDNYVLEPKVVQRPHGFNKGSVQEDCPSITSSYFQENNYIAEPIVYDDYNSRISSDQDAIHTLTCNCGASAERNGVKIIEPMIVDDIYNNREPRIYDEYAPTLRSERTGLKVVEEDVIAQLLDYIKWRIRKLTTKECWRLMGFSDEDHDRAAQYVSASALYKQAGNSICTSCLISIFYSLFFNDSSSKYKQYLVKFDD